MSFKLVMLSNHLILCCPLLLPASIFPSIRVFSNESNEFQSIPIESGGQSIRASASASVLLKNIRGWFPVGCTSLISLQSKGLSRLFSSTTTWKHWFLGAHPTPVLLPGKSHGLRSLVGCSQWGREELDTTERLPFHFSLSCIGEGNGNPLQCSCLENPRDGGVWWAAVYGVAQSRTRLKQLSSSSSRLLYVPTLTSVHDN